MLKNLERKIEFYARKYATLVAEGKDETPLGYERWGKILGLCQAHRLLTGDERAHIALAFEAVEQAKFDLNFVDDEGNAI